MMINFVYDIVGIGLGPANLALAAAIYEHDNIKAKFLECKSEFSWHPNMLLDDAEMQIPFLKDIATLRNPQSPFTFINYLHSKDRLTKFINLKYIYPSRHEYSDYLKWVANQLAAYTQYSSQVIDIELYGRKPYKYFKIIYKNLLNNTTSFIITKNIVIAQGGKMKLPQCINKDLLDQNVWHSSEYLLKIKKFKNESHLQKHFCVVGGGQSAAEIAYDLYKSFPTSKVTLIHRGFGLKPADDSAYVNEIFDKTHVDTFFDMNKQNKDNMLNNYKDTNYSVVDIELIDKLYKIQYEDLVNNSQRFFIKKQSSLSNVSIDSNNVNIEIEQNTHSKQKEKIQATALILATGYEYPNPPSTLSTLDNFIKRDSNGDVSINKNYKLNLDESILGHIYTLGCNEKSHGLTDTLLSLSAIRAKLILDELLGKLFNNIYKTEDAYYESA